MGITNRGVRRAWSLAVALACAAAPLLAGLARAEGPAEGSPFVLAATTTVRASGPRVAAVSLPTDAQISGPDDIEIKGNGRFYGFVLSRDDAGPMPQLLVGMMARYCWKPGCFQQAPPPAEHFSSDFAVDSVGSETLYTLPAGDYHLYVLADQKPVTVTIRLRGLTGSAQLDVTGGVAYEIRPLVNEWPTDAGDNLLSAGSGQRVYSKKVFVFSALVLEAGTYFDSSVGTCLYVDADAPMDRYLPGCPDGRPGPPVYRTHAGPVAGMNLLWTHAEGVAPANWDLGWYALTAAWRPRYHLTQGWLSID